MKIADHVQSRCSRSTQHLAKRAPSRLAAVQKN
jgi:hypothetical protein